MSDTESETDDVPGIGTADFLAANSDLEHTLEHSPAAVRKAVETLKALDLSAIHVSYTLREVLAVNDIKEYGSSR
jgi:hypothetical protein